MENTQNHGESGGNINRGFWLPWFEKSKSIKAKDIGYPKCPKTKNKIKEILAANTPWSSEPNHIKG